MTVNKSGCSSTRTQLVVLHIKGRNNTPIAIVNGFPGLDAEMTSEDLLQMSRQLRHVANDLGMRIAGMARYPEDV